MSSQEQMDSQTNRLGIDQVHCHHRKTRASKFVAAEKQIVLSHLLQPARIMIAASTASLVVSVAKGLVKLGQRMDALLAAKESVQAKVILVQPEIYSGPSALKKVAELKKYLSDTAAKTSSDPLGDDRDELAS